MRIISENTNRRKFAFNADHTGKGQTTVSVGKDKLSPVFADLGIGSSGREISESVACGVRLFRLKEVSLGWNGVGEFDDSSLEIRLNLLKASAPEVNFLLQICVDAPEWWLAKHAVECVKYSVNRADSPNSASFASKVWRSEAGNALGRLLKNLLGSEHGSRLIGVQLTAGNEGEWRPFAPELFPDTGIPMSMQFHRFAEEKYRRNELLLRQGWDDPKVDFRKTHCPTVEERQRGLRGVLRNPKWSKKTFDYYECVAQAQNEAVLHFCKVVRQVSSGKICVGVSYAPAFGIEPFSEDGHAFPEAVLDSPDIDFFALKGTMEGHIRALTGSLALRNKFFLHETPVGSDLPNALESALKQNSGIALPVKALEPLKTALSKYSAKLNSVATPQKPSRALAVFLDPASRRCLADPKPGKEPLDKLLLEGQIRELLKTEIPFELYITSDLFLNGFPDYKAYLFLNSFYLSDAERRKIEAKVKRSGQIGIFMWGAGILTEDDITAEAGEKLIGMKQFVEDKETSLRVRVTAKDPSLGSWLQGRPFGSERALLPVVTIGDREAIRLGMNSADRTTFALRRFEQWTSISCQSSIMPAGIIKTLLIAGHIPGEKKEKKTPPPRKAKPKKKSVPASDNVM